MGAFQALEGTLGALTLASFIPTSPLEPLQEDPRAQSGPSPASAAPPGEEARAGECGPGPAGPEGGELPLQSLRLSGTLGKKERKKEKGCEQGLGNNAANLLATGSETDPFITLSFGFLSMIK